MDVLLEKGYDIPEAAIRRGLQTVSWPGRFEVVSRRPLCILDGAHNPNGVAALMDTLRDFLPGFSFTFVVGVMADKDYHRMLQMAAPLAERFIAELPDSGSDRGLQTEKLAAEIRKYFSGPVETAPTVTAGLARACALAASETAPLHSKTTLTGPDRQAVRHPIRAGPSYASAPSTRPQRSGRSLFNALMPF